MGWKHQFLSLYNRLKSSLGNPDRSTLDKRISRLATKKGLSGREALFILASENNVGYAREFSMLSDDERTRISQVISTKSPFVPSSNKANIEKQKIRVLQIKTNVGIIKDPYLDPAIMKEAMAAAETAYLYLYIFENSIRNFIIMVMVKTYSEDWWDKGMRTKALQEIKKCVDGRLSSEQKHSFHGKRGSHPLFYSDYGDLITVMSGHEADFNQYFHNLPGKLKGFLFKLREIEPSRNVTAHNNPLAKKDLHRVEGYLGDWLAQLAYIKLHGLL